MSRGLTAGGVGSRGPAPSRAVRFARPPAGQRLARQREHGRTVGLLEDPRVHHRGLEAVATPPKLEGKGLLAANMANLPGTDPEDDPLLPGEIETPLSELDAGALVRQLGGGEDRAGGRELRGPERRRGADGVRPLPVQPPIVS